MLELSSVGKALEALSTFFLQHNLPELVFIGRSGHKATMGYAVIDGNIPGMLQLQDAAMAMALNIMRDLLGADWRPTGVRLMRREPLDSRLYANFFGVPCRFNATRSELVFPATTLDMRLKSPDAKVNGGQGAGLAQYSQDDRDWSAYVQRVAYLLLLQGECSQKRVAAALGISDRTLVRKMGNCGVTYQELFERVRFSTSRTLIRETNLELAEIAGALGYNEASSFTRAFHRWAGMSPSQWRKLKTVPASLPSSKK